MDSPLDKLSLSFVEEMAFKADPSLVGLTIAQINKDFALQGYDLVLPEGLTRYEQIHMAVEAYLLSRNGIHGVMLPNLLYQLGVEERSAAKYLGERDFYPAFAHLIIRSCFEKVNLRRNFENRPEE